MPAGTSRDEANLATNEAAKSATMVIDEPETPWASPPRELLEDDDAAHGAETHSDLSRVAARLTGSAADGGAHGASVGGNVEREAGAAVPDEDAVLRKRLFEARRKAMQCSTVRNPAVTPDAKPDADAEGGETTDTMTEVEADGQKARVP